MADESITLQIGASTRTLAAWGITGASLVTTAGGNDSLTLQTAEPIDAPPLIAPFTRCELRIAGDRLFTGWLDQAPLQAQGGNEGRSYTLTGPQRWLDQAHYLQDTVTTVDGAPALQTRASGRVVLNQRLVESDGLYDTEKPTLAEQIADLFAVVDTAHPDQVAVLTTDLPAASLPEDERTDTTCWSALQILLRWVPAITPYWDYTPDKPTLKFVGAGAGPARTLQATAEEATAISPRFDLLCRSVTVRYVQDSGDGREIQSVDTAGPTGDAADLEATRDHVETIVLRNAECGSPEAIPTGLAAAFNAFASRLHNEGAFTLPGLNRTHRPGDAWSILAPYTGLGTGSSPAQTITRDLFTHRTTIQIGPPGWLGIQDAYDLSLGNRTRRPASDCANQPFQTPQEPDISGGPLEPVAIPGTNDVRVFLGFAAGLMPTGMSLGDDPPYILENLPSGVGLIYLVLTTDSEGEPQTLDIGTLHGATATLPDDDNTTAYYALGSYSVATVDLQLIATVNASGAGNLNYLRIRDWFSNPATYTHFWDREAS